MFKSSRLSDQPARRPAPVGRRAALAGILILMLSFVAYVSPAVGIRARAGDPEPPPSGPTTTGAKPLQAICSVSTSRAVVGEFSPVVHLPLVPVHLSVLPDGRVLFWGRDRGRDANGNVKEVSGKSEAYVWNIADGSNKTDVAVWRPAEGNWFIINSSTGATRITTWGLNGDRPVPGDYDGDGKADLAVFRPSEGNWHIFRSSTGTSQIVGWGYATDITVPGDYDGDGKTDVAIFRPTEGNWYIINSSNGATQIRQHGANGDIPVPKDYDRDGKADLAVFRPSESTWQILQSSNNSPRIFPLGALGDVPVPGDYNGDGSADAAVFRPSTGGWHISYSIASQTASLPPWGGPSDIATPGDYDGDHKTDAAVFRPSDGKWYIRNSSDGLTQTRTWGVSGDVMVPADYDGMLRVANTTTNLFCSGHSFMPDGRLLVTGGHRSADFDRAGESHTNIFDYRSNRWTRGPDMNQGRWYPYNVTLNSGETLVLAGDYWANEPTSPPAFATNLVPQLYTAGGTLRNLSQPGSITFYPYLHLMPNGKVLQAQSGFTNPLDTNTLDQDSRVFDPDANSGAGSWSSLGSMLFPHAMGTSVLFDSGRKALVVGGFDNTYTPTNRAEFINMKPAQGQPTWASLPPMNYNRAYHTGTILPNGKVLVTGGTGCRGGNHVENLQASCPDGRNMVAEMWDPTANPADPSQVPWCKVAQQREVRAYHSVAALLPDGRVLVGGGGLPGAVGEVDANNQKIARGTEAFARLFGHKNVELYSPPYLFDASGNPIGSTPGARPSITSAPTSISYGQTFSVGTSNAGSSPKVSLVRLASVTHGFNQDQRHAFLSATVSGSTLSVTGPADSNKVPPGHYMLFVMNSNGVPSVAKIVRVTNTAAYEGHVDGINCGQVWGWAWNRAAPNKPISVSIYDGTTLLGTVSANLFRQDLLNADKGNGSHAFAFTIPPSVLNGASHSISVRYSGTSTNLSSSPQPLVCRSMFPSPPGTVEAVSGAGQTWEQATQFSSSVSGYVTHLRYWKVSGETGVHVGRLWSEAGAQLAQVTFTNETASGWQVQVLPSPVPVTPGVRYRVSYNVNQFGAKIVGGLGSPITNGPLTAWGSAYRTPAGTFPNTGSVSNFLADIIFSTPQ